MPGALAHCSLLTDASAGRSRQVALTPSMSTSLLKLSSMGWQWYWRLPQASSCSLSSCSQVEVHSCGLSLSSRMQSLKSLHRVHR